MKKLWLAFGTLVYWLTFPGTWLILNNTERSRLLMLDGDKALVVKGWLGAGKWGLPGGGMHKNESAEASLIREVYEELGFELKPADISLILSEPLSVHGTKLLLHYFTAKKPKELSIRPQRIEIGEYAWVKLSELHDKNSNPDLLRAIEAKDKHKS